MKKLLIVIVGVSLAFGVTRSSRAAGDGEPGSEQLIEEFFFSRNAHLQDRGELQLGLGLQHKESWLVEAEAEYGISDRLQVSLGVSTEGEDESIEGGLAFAVIAKEGRFGLAAGLDASRSRSAQEVELFLAGVTDVGKGEVHSEISWETQEGETGLRMAGVYPFQRLRATMELISVHSEDTSFGVVPGVLYKILPNFEIGVAVPIDVDGSDLPQFAFRATIEF